MISSLLPLARVQVYNRIDCCSERVVGATISIESDAGGGGLGDHLVRRFPIWSDVFTGDKPVYTFVIGGLRLLRVVCYGLLI
jgi:hypothetical protein